MSKYYVVSGDILPDVLEQVMQARILLQSGKAKRISEAVKMVGISRGTYYKYKDAVFSFNAEQSNRKAIISMILRNEKGTLSKVLSLVSVKQVNVLAINQTIPINGIANVALTLDISDLEISIQSLVSLIEAMPMVEKASSGLVKTGLSTFFIYGKIAVIEP